MIELKDVSKYYNSNGVVTVALKHINLKLNKNEIVAITGESGSGKSTLLNIITGMDNYDDGEIYFKGNETSYFNNDDMDNFRKKHVGFIFQNYNIIDSYTVLQNVMLPLLINGMNKKEAKEKALDLIERVGLNHRIKNRGSKLSGGEKQRVVIARALASDSDILACDEPTGNLDSKTGKEIIDLIKEISKDKLVLIVTHNYDEVKDIATRKIVVSDGDIIKDEVIEPTEDDENVTLNLDNKPVEKKTLGLLTKFNILSTPRKSILIILIFLAVSLILYTTPQSIYYNVYKSNETYQYANYPVNMNNYLIAHDEDGIDSEALAKISGDINTDPYLEYEKFNSQISYTHISYNINYAPYDLPYDLKEGNLGDGEDDAILIFPENYSFTTEEIDRLLVFNKVDDTMEFNITGKAKSKYASGILLKTNRDYKDFFNEGLKANMIDAYFNRKKITVNVTKNVEKACLNYSENYTKDELKLDLCFANAYDINFDYELNKTNNNEEMILEINPDYIDSLKLKTFEARIITDDISGAKNILDKANIKYIYPATEAPRDVLTNLMLFIYIILLIGPIIIFYIMTYFILSRVYVSKVKEYTIMRTLGICKNDMNKMVMLETMIYGLTSALFIYLLTTILGFTVPHNAFRMFSFINLPISIIYFVAVLIFSYSLAKRFNKKLFAKTGAKTLKEGE